MNKDPKIAIILPVFRNHRALQEAVQSILNQSVADDFPMELAIIDDGSNDSGRTWTKILDMERKIKTERSSIKVIPIKRYRNDGQSFARIIGIAKTTAPWICYLDVDDICHKDRIKNLWQHIDEFESESTELLFFRYNQEDKRQTPPVITTVDPEACTKKHGSVDIAVQKEKITDTLGFAHTRELYDRVGGWPPFLINGEDIVIIRRMVQVAKGISFSDKLAGTKRIYKQGQGIVGRRFDSGLYIILDLEDNIGATGQYLDDRPSKELFVKVSEDPEYAKRNLKQYVCTLTI